MTPMERFAVRKQAKKATWRSAASPLDRCATRVCRAYSAFYAAQTINMTCSKAELVLYEQLNVAVKIRDDTRAGSIMYTIDHVVKGA